MANRPNSDVTVVLKQSAPPALCPFRFEDGALLDRETFRRQESASDWFGFYDWLRKSDGRVIGVRLRPDDGEIADDDLRRLMSVDSNNTLAEVRIFFGSDREFDPAQSDDADFGGNVLFRGSQGSLAMTFNAPARYGER